MQKCAQMFCKKIMGILKLKLTLILKSTYLEPTLTTTEKLKFCSKFNVKEQFHLFISHKMKVNSTFYSFYSFLVMILP